MTGWQTGDAASVSAFAAELIRAAAVLEQRTASLARLPAELACWTGEAAGVFERRLAGQTDGMGRAAQALAHCGQALQKYAVDLQEAKVAAARAQLFCAEHGLQVDVDRNVRLPWGAYAAADAVAFAGSLPQGQRLVEAADAAVDDAVRRLRSAVADAVAAFGVVAAALRETHSGQTGHVPVER